MMVIIATRPKLCNTIYIWHKHDTIMEDLGVIVYLLLHCGGGFRLEDHGVYFCAAIYLVAEFQKWQFFFFSFLFFFSSLSWKSHFHDSSSNAVIDWPIGACSLLTSHFCTWYQVHHLMETLKASRVGTSGKEAFDSCTAEICQSQGSHTFKNTLLFFLFKGICKHNFLWCEEDFAKCVQRLSQKAVFA